MKPVREMTQREIDDARALIGEQKLSLRQRHRIDAILDLLRPLNRQLDELNAEDLRRQRLTR